MNIHNLGEPRLTQKIVMDEITISTFINPRQSMDPFQTALGPVDPLHPSRNR